MIFQLPYVAYGAFHVKYTQGSDIILSDFDDFWYTY